MTSKTNYYKIQLSEKTIVVLQQVATLEVRTVETLDPASSLRSCGETRGNMCFVRGDEREETHVRGDEGEETCGKMREEETYAELSSVFYFFNPISSSPD